MKKTDRTLVLNHLKCGLFSAYFYINSASPILQPNRQWLYITKCGHADNLHRQH